MGSGSNQKRRARCKSGSHKTGNPRQSGRHRKGVRTGKRKEETKKRAAEVAKARAQVNGTVHSMKERICVLEKELKVAREEVLEKELNVARDEVQATMKERICELEKHMSWEQARRIASEADAAKYRARYLAARGARLPPGSDLLL